MARISKRLKAISEKVDRTRYYPLQDALNLVRETAIA
jgi:large subunit ribosomal protein L1